ncbi:COG3637 Opacity protein and related surface antigens [Oxalobacteraceae bacterium]
MQKILGFMVLSAALVMPLAGHAEGSYFKAGVGSSEYKFEGSSENKTAVSAAYGFAVDKNFDVELGYANLGKFKFSDADESSSLQMQSFYIAGVGTLPLTDAFSVFGKLGVTANHFNSKFTDSDGTISNTDTKARALLGLGLAYNFTKQIAGTLEYQYFGKVEDIKFSALTVGVKYGF